MSWLETEKKCVDYIKSITKNNKDIIIEEAGASDSTAPDIIVKRNEQILFNVEIKEANSQAGQFVIFDDENGEYSFSKRNKCKVECCQPIIDYINNNKKLFKSIGTAGTNICCDKSLMYNRVTSYYENEKNTKYFITMKDEKFIIFKTNDLDKFFDISGCVRRKKSGSKNVSEYLSDCVKDKVNSYFLNEGLSLDDFYYSYDGHHFQVVFNDGTDHNLGGKKFETDCFMVNFSKHKSGDPIDRYTITLLSNTNNPNIIFTLDLKNNYPDSQEDIFLNELK